MIHKLKLTQFRNFLSREFFFSEDKNYIIGENGKGKTNILESLSLLTSNSITGIGFENLVNQDSEFFHIEMSNTRNDSLSIFFDKELSKKKYSINSKATSKKKFSELSLKSVLFSPFHMNMMYLSPSLRRDFLDNILKSSFPEYSDILGAYKKSLSNRNKVLKNISKNKSSKSEILFWDKKFIIDCEKVYEYRKQIIQYLEENSQSLKKGFNGKISDATFNYISNIDLEKSISQQISHYLEKNIDRDIMLKSTNIGPHRDDFSIILNESVNLVDFASRGEVKTTILGLKNIEITFIEKHTSRKPILIIDDLLSELDKTHKDFLIESIHGYQTFISGIELDDIGESNVLTL
ncbi:DNA replication and repair protein RecF [Candidatus Gracilibacteria bacterium]|nr:DNA replication and repair protein RecF [Candidatus Gracilibacteria bacterium]